jgi:tetratricopeptide (TPR) repeat protein
MSIPRMRAAIFTLPALVFALIGFQAEAQDGNEALKLYLNGKYDDSLRVCLEELALSPDNIDSYVVLSWSLLALERWADAENYALKGYALRKDPRLTEALGEAAFYLGRNEASLRNFQNYVSAVPEGGRVGLAYYYMGEVYLRMSRFGHADIAFTTALQYSPGNARWWARLGWAREKAGDPVHALEAYARALALDGRLQDALNGKERVATRIRQ